MSLTNEQRQEVVTETKSWLGTKYVGWVAIKGYGADCGQLIFGIYRNCGFISPDIYLPKDYSLQVAQHQASTEYIDIVNTYMREISQDEVLPGDVVVFRLGLAFAHAGIVINYPSIIHTLAYGGCQGGNLDRHPKLFKAQRKYFTLRDEYCLKQETA
jgi:cell wall-associated NlpC family hydrolase